MKKKSKISILIFIFLLVTVFYPLLEMLIRVEWSDFECFVAVEFVEVVAFVEVAVP